MEAVTQYMLKNDMNYHSDTNVMEMSLARRVVIGLNALQEANREGELIPKAIMDALRNELSVGDIKHILAENTPSTPVAPSDDALITYHRTDTGQYWVYNHGTRIATIIKDGTNKSKPWMLYVDDEEFEFRVLTEAKDAVEGMWE